MGGAGPFVCVCVCVSSKFDSLKTSSPRGNIGITWLYLRTLIAEIKQKPVRNNSWGRKICFCFFQQPCFVANPLLSA